MDMPHHRVDRDPRRCDLWPRATVREVFPQVTEGELRRALLSSSSLEAAIESLLDGLDH